jgi:hypothetical protein
MVQKHRQVLFIIVIGALSLGSFSIWGLLQSRERIAASGIIIRPVEDSKITPPSSTPNPPPPEPEIMIDVYSDPECTSMISAVEWGDIEAGATSNVQIYVKNIGDTSAVISLMKENWSSAIASNNMNLSWDYDGSPIQSGEARDVLLSLSVDPDCPELNSFGFDIVIMGS